MSAVFLAVFNMSVAGAWVILIVLVLRAAGRKAPAGMRCALWGIAALRLAVPVWPSGKLSLVPSGQTLPAGMLYESQPVLQSGVDAIDRALNPGFAHSMSPAAGASVNPLQVLTEAAALVWAAGVVCMLAYALLSAYRLRRKMAEAVPAGGGVWVCDAARSPFILGIAKPRIFLASDMNAQQTHYVLAHERAHLARRDHWWKPLGFVLLAVHWFNPLVWAAYLLFCRDVEQACDERVIKTMETAQRKEYSRALLQCSAPRRTAAACPLAFGETGIRQRIRAVLQWKRPGKWVLAGTAAVCAAAAALCLTTRSTYPMQLSLDGRVYTYSTLLDEDLPNGSRQVARLTSMGETGGQPQEDGQGVNIPERYLGCPIFRSGTDGSVVYLITGSRCIPFVCERQEADSPSGQAQEQPDAQAEITRLFEVLTAAASEQSAPQWYAENAPEEYRQLLQYGDDTLRWVFGQFLQGGQTDLRGWLMSSVMFELTGGEAIKCAASTGQEYFDAWNAHVCSLLQQNGRQFMQEHYPKGWLLLQMSGEV